jgi:hypothetical protein
MSSKSRNRRGKKPARRFIEVGEVANGMKPGEVKQIGENIYVFPVFVLDPPEPIKKPAKAKIKKKSA